MPIWGNFGELFPENKKMIFQLLPLKDQGKKVFVFVSHVTRKSFLHMHIIHKKHTVSCMLWGCVTAPGLHRIRIFKSIA